MELAGSERSLLRDLARRVAEIAAAPEHATRREWWIRHNRLERVKPMVLVFPEGSWVELLPPESLVIADPTWRNLEFHLRHLIYRAEHLRDDNVITGILRVGLSYSHSGWGLTPGQINSPEARGAWGFDAPMKSPEQAKELHVPEIVVDEERTQARLVEMQEVLGDILEVRLERRVHVDTSLIGHLVRLRGLDQIMLDMCDRPQWLHDVMEFMTAGTERLLDQVEQNGWLCLNNEDHYVGSGGVAYTDQLPGPGFDGRVRLGDLWGFAEAQELAVVSPAMLDEFVLTYQARLLSRFGLNAYGCCESLTHKLPVVKRIPHLRRVSVSPWTDLRVAAEELGDRYIFSWKPNPAELAMPVFDEERIRAGLREAVEIARGGVLEIIMKDTHTVNGEPHRLTRWVEIAQEVAAEAG